MSHFKIIKKTIFMKELIKDFVAKHSNVGMWFYYYSGKPEKVVEMYQVIKTMWFDYRDLFPNKGTYKTVRRLFIKYAAAYYVSGRYHWYDLPEDLLAEIIYKGRQHWLPRCDAAMLIDHLRMELYQEQGDKAKRYKSVIKMYHWPRIHN